MPKAPTRVRSLLPAPCSLLRAEALRRALEVLRRSSGALVRFARVLVRGGVVLLVDVLRPGIARFAGVADFLVLGPVRDGQESLSGGFVEGHQTGRVKALEVFASPLEDVRSFFEGPDRGPDEPRVGEAHTVVVDVGPQADEREACGQLEVGDRERSEELRLDRADAGHGEGLLSGCGGWVV